MKRRETVLLLLAGALLAASPAAATTISITGMNGVAGANGAAGNPGGDGATGGDGQDATAVADVSGENNQATATGGTGGRGGTGGNGVPAGADSGDGGDGGSGGDATARAIGTGASSVSATAIGGDRGAGGAPGTATAPGVRGEFGVAGIGGDALAEATLDTDLASLATATATAGREFSSPFEPQRPGRAAVAHATAVNGSGGATSTAGAFAGRAAAGAPAEATALATGSGDGAVTATAEAETDGEGNHATATARGTTDGTGAVTVSATANGGGGVSPMSTATAYGSNAGAAPVVVQAHLGFDTFFSSGENLIADAEGHSTGGGDVTVEAAVYRRSVADLALATPGVSLHDAVRGSTAGRLTLSQLVDVLPSPFVFTRTGETRTSLHATNPGGGDLSVDIFAGGGAAADLVLGDILATSETGADVDIDVFASAGPIGGRIVQENRSDGSAPTPARIHAESNGGNVRTRVQFGVNQGYRFYTGTGEPHPLDHPDGSSVEMVDVASGDTTGALSLEQTAKGGRGFETLFFDLPPGSGGSALSALLKSTASSELELRSSAYAGDAGSAASPSADRTGGDAIASVDGSNSAGAARSFALAQGGIGYGGLGGDARVETSASTTGDGREVVVGEVLSYPQFFGSGPGAWGGGGGQCIGCSSSSYVSAGGNASSTSTGIASGDSLVTVFDNAIGGNGGASSRRPSVQSGEGPGGDASSFATAIGGGTSAVKAKSEALGGAGGARESEPGGDADATASAVGLGLVEAWARATGGKAMPTGVSGSALAHATADGASGFARAEASTGTGSLPQLRAQSQAQVGSRVDVASATTRGASLASAPSDPGLEGSAFFTGAPLAEDVDAALAGNQALAEAFESEGTAMLALARWQGDASDGPLTLSTDLEIVMNAPDSTKKLLIGAFDLSIAGDGFESLSLSLTKNGFSQRSTLFSDTAEEVIAFFTDSVLDLGVGWNASDKFVAHFDLALGAGTRFAMGLGYATAVPEPSTVVLLVLGLIGLASSRRITACGLIRPTIRRSRRAD